MRRSLTPRKYEITNIDISRSDINQDIENKYSLDTIYMLKHYIISSFYIQLICFVLKLLSLIMATCLLIIVWVNGDIHPYSILAGGFSIASCLIITVIIFYYVGIVNARLNGKLKFNFKVFMCFNYFFSAASAVGFGYTIKVELFDNSITLYYKNLYIYGIIVGIGVYYLLGVTMFAFLTGHIINIGKLIWYHFEFLFNVLTARLFTIIFYDPPKVLPIQQSDRKEKNEKEVEGAELKYTRGVSYNNTQIDLNPISQLQDIKANAQPQREESYLEYNTADITSKQIRCIQKVYNEIIQARICIICKEGFVLGELVAELTCNPTHVFHSQCLEDTRANGKQEECPICYRTYII